MKIFSFIRAQNAAAYRAVRSIIVEAFVTEFTISIELTHIQVANSTLKNRYIFQTAIEYNKNFLFNQHSNQNNVQL